MKKKKKGRNERREKGEKQKRERGKNIAGSEYVIRTRPVTKKMLLNQVFISLIHLIDPYKHDA